jgi:hypothetical protein
MNKQSSPSKFGFDTDLAAKIDALEKAQALEAETKCSSCGAVAKQKRLTCEACGNYFERGVQASVFDNWDKPPTSRNSALTNEEAALDALKSYLVKRILAKGIDTVILGSLLATEIVTAFSVARAFSAVPAMAALTLAAITYGLPILMVMSVLVYQAAFESSPVQATLGKLLLGLYVEGADDRHARFEPLFFKTLVTAMPALAFVGAYAYFFFTKLKYGILLDAASTSVLAISGVACFVTYLSLHIIVGGEKKRQTVADMLNGLVVKER